MPNQALFYPWIEIKDDQWLKTSLLYWDEVSNHCSRINRESIQNGLYDCALQVKDYCIVNSSAT